MSKIVINRVACATILALGTVAAGVVFAATPSEANTYTPVAYQPSDPRSDIDDLTWRANQMDELINNNESAILTSRPDLGTQWMNRIVVSGVLNVDGRVSSRSYGTNTILNNGLINPNYFGTGGFFPAPTGFFPLANNGVGAWSNPNYGSIFGRSYSSTFALNDSEIDVDAQINCWVKAHIALTGEDNNQFTNNDAFGIFTSPIAHTILFPISQDALVGRTAGHANQLQPDEQKFATSDRWIDEAYITLGDFTQTPFFGTVGREYVPFGHYQKHELTPELTTYLTETQATAANAGFVTPFYNCSNVYGSAFALDGLAESNNSQFVAGFTGAPIGPIPAGIPLITGDVPTGLESARIRNFGGDIGINKTDQAFGYSGGVSFLDNLADVNTISNVITGQGFGTGNLSGGFNKNVPALSGYAGANYGPFSGHVDGMTSLARFSPNDLAWGNNFAGFGLVNLDRGAKPSSVDAKVGYAFTTLNRDSQVYFRYGHSWEAVALALPQNQYVGGYSLDLAKNTTVELQVIYNDDYSRTNGGTGLGDWEGAARLSVAL